MDDQFIENIDPQLQERIEECKRLNSTLPLTKEIVKYKILERRAQQGLGKVDTTFGGEKTFPLTVEEEEKRKRRKEQNKKAAARCRNRRKLRDKVLTQEFGEELEKNALLRESWKQLKAEKDGLVSQLVEHEISCSISAHRGQLSYTNNQNYDNESYHKHNNDKDLCHSYLADKLKPTSGHSSSDFLSVTNAEDGEPGSLFPLSYDTPYTPSLFQNGAALKKADDNSFIGSNTLTFVGPSNEENIPVDIAPFAYPSPPSSPSFPIIDSSPTPFTFPPTSFPFPPLSIHHLSPANLSPRPIPLTSDSFSSPSSFPPTETRLLQSPRQIGFPSSTNRHSCSSNHPVYLTPWSSQASLSSPSQFSPPSPYSFSPPSSSSFSGVCSPSTLQSDRAPTSIFVPGNPNSQPSNCRMDDNLLDAESLIPSIVLYNRSEDSTPSNIPEKSTLRKPQQDSQNQGASLFTSEEGEPRTDTQCVQDSDSGDNTNNFLQFPLQLSLEPFEQTQHSPFLKDISDQYVSNQNEFVLPMYI